MISIARKMLNDGDLAKDVVQEVFVYLFEKLNTGHAIHHHKGWLTRATINKCIDTSNRQNKFQNIDTVSTIKEEEDCIEKLEARDVVYHALSKLKPKERILAILYSEGFSYKEIAETTGIKYTSIGKMLSRTLIKMKEEFKMMNYELH